MRRWVLLAALLACACNGSSSANGPELRQQAEEPHGGPSIEVVKVVARKLATIDYLPAELTSYQSVAIYPRVSGFVEKIPVDRGSVVRRGQLLARLSAPELLAQRAEADAKASADRATYQRLKEAAKTKGAVAENELELAEDALKADSERVRSLETLEGYLTIRAPFDGIITERDVHPGALVGPPSSSGAVPIVRIEENDHLRLTVPVPERDVGAIKEGVTAEFTVSTWPGERFTGTIARVSHSVDKSTRTMPVELDVNNRDGRLAPGMFAEVRWPVHRDVATLFVPASAVAETMEKVFVDAVRDGRVRCVVVKRGQTQDDLVEVFGDLRQGDLVAVRGSEELAEGTRVSAHLRTEATASASK